MARIVLISCVKGKLDRRAAARDLYTSPLFRYMLAYAESLKPDMMFVLSAKYGLIGLDDEIDPYEKTLNNMGKDERMEWSENVISRLNEVSDLDNDEYILLAGKNYIELLAKNMKNYSVPLKGMGFGERVKYLKSVVDAGKSGK